MWWFPPLVLQTAAFALSACLGVLVYIISYFAWRHENQAKAVGLWLCAPLCPSNGCASACMPFLRQLWELSARTITLPICRAL